jgi:hypothetical protein
MQRSELPPARRRAVLTALIERVEVRVVQINIHLRPAGLSAPFDAAGAPSADASPGNLAMPLVGMANSVSLDFDKDLIVPSGRRVEPLSILSGSPTLKATAARVFASVSLVRVQASENYGKDIYRISALLATRDGGGGDLRSP